MAELTNYVKFLRGTPAAYKNLAKKDNDTLYFITGTGQSFGKLYLGDILVASGVPSDGTEIIDSLGKLADVNLAGLKTGQVLGFNGTEWIPVSLPEAIEGSIMIGATATQAGSAGFVPTPQAGDETKFLRGDGTWAEVQGASIDLSEYAKISQIESMLDELDDDFITNEEIQELNTKITALEENRENIEESLTWGNIL